MASSHCDIYLSIIILFPCFFFPGHAVCVDQCLFCFVLFFQAVLNLQPPLEYSKEVNEYKNLIKTLVMGNLFLFLDH